MTKIRVTKEFYFETAHALWNYDGLCKNLHGHSYKLFVSVIGTPNTDKNSPKLGMVIDFGALKRIVNQEIVNKIDHAILLNKTIPQKDFLQVKQMFERLYLLDYQPTCENMVADFAARITPHLPKNVKLFSIRLYETATSFAEWFAADQEG